jgi:DNA primase
MALVSPAAHRPAFYLFADPRSVSPMIQPNFEEARTRATQYNRRLPPEVRRYLKDRGIPDAVIDRELLGWTGSRISIPIFGREGEVLSFRFAKSPTDTTPSPKVLSEVGARPEIYGWKTLARELYQVVICEGEFDRLVLEARGIPAVTSTAGAGVFLPDWAPFFSRIRHVYICFDRDEAGEIGAKNVCRFLPQAKIIRLPQEVGEKGDVTDYFVRLGKTIVDFRLLLAEAAAAEENESKDADPAEGSAPAPPKTKAVAKRAANIKAAVRLQAVVSRYLELRPVGGNLVGRCPFHEDTKASFTLYPETDTYFCFGCRAHGDVIAFLMHKESLTYGQALERLERFRYTHEL